MFGSDALSEVDTGSKRPSMDFHDGPDATTLLKMNVGGMTVDFAAMIEEVVSTTNEADIYAKTTDRSPGDSQGFSTTPDEPTMT